MSQSPFKSLRLVAVGAVVTGLVALSSGCIFQDWQRAETVRRVYKEIVHQEPTVEQLDNWVKEMGNGMTEEELRTQISLSPEYYKVRVRQLYLDVLKREPDPSGMETWTEYLKTQQGSEDDLVKMMKSSQEYRVNFGPTPEAEAQTVRKIFSEQGQTLNPHQVKEYAVMLEMGQITPEQLKQEAAGMNKANAAPKADAAKKDNS